MLGEPPQVVVPEAFVVGQPVVDLSQWLGGEAIASLAPMSALGDQSGIQQNTQVLRDRWPADAEVARDVIDGALTLGQEVEDAPPHGMGNRPKDFRLCVIVHTSIIRKQLLTYQAQATRSGAGRRIARSGISCGREGGDPPEHEATFGL